MAWRARIAACAALLSTVAAEVAAGSITAARFAEPVTRYGHFALGRPHEYARLVVDTDSGRKHELVLPDEDVFEDLQPRLVRLAADAPVELLTIVSRRDAGARLVLFGLDGGRIVMRAQSEPIGTPNRWLNPVGVADLDGDGRGELAAIITPHIGGILKVYRRDGAALVELAAMTGLSNHVYGSPELGLSTPARVRGQARLLVPDQRRTSLRFIALTPSGLTETGRCEVEAPIVGPVRQGADGRISVGLDSGRRVTLPDDCGG